MTKGEAAGEEGEGDGGDEGKDRRMREAADNDLLFASFAAEERRIQPMVKPSLTLGLSPLPAGPADQVGG